MFKTVLALALAASITPAIAQESPPAPKCAPVDDIIKEAREQYNEVPVLIGKLSKEGYFILVMGTVDGASWTIVSAGPDGLACLVATGTGMKEIKSPAAGSRDI